MKYKRAGPTGQREERRLRRKEAMEFDTVRRAGKIKWKNSIWSDVSSSTSPVPEKRGNGRKVHGDNSARHTQYTFPRSAGKGAQRYEGTNLRSAGREIYYVFAVCPAVKNSCERTLPYGTTCSIFCRLRGCNINIFIFIEPPRRVAQ